MICNQGEQGDTGMVDWWGEPEVQAEWALNSELLRAALMRLRVPSNYRLGVRGNGARWILEGGGCEVLWFDEPSQAEIDRATWRNRVA